MMNTIILYGADWCPDCRRVKAFLKENTIDFTFIDVDLNKEATSKVEEINYGKRILPTLIISGKKPRNSYDKDLKKLLS